MPPGLEDLQHQRDKDRILMDDATRRSGSCFRKA